MKTNIFIGIAVALLLVTGCATTGNIVKEQTIDVGVIASLTGLGAYLGGQEVKGVTLATEEINADGGIDGKQVKLIIEDSGTDTARAVSALHKLITINEVSYVIGDTWATTTEALVPVANDNRIILISPLANLDSLSADDYFFRTVPTTEEFVKPLATYAYDELGARTAALMVADNPFGIEHAEDFKEAFSGRIVAEEHFETGAQDMKTQLTKIKQAQPDIIFDLQASGASVGRMIAQANELGIRTQWIAAYTAENAALMAAYPNEIEGIVYPYPYDGEAGSARSQAFVKAYEERYGEAPDNAAASSYDALWLLKEAIERGGEDTASAREALKAIKEYEGGSSTLSFDENGDVHKEVFIKTVKEGEFVRIS